AWSVNMSMTDVPMDLRHASLSARRRFVDVFAKVLMSLAVLLAVIPLGAVVYYTVLKGYHSLNPEFLFGSKLQRQPDVAGGSMGPAIVGTLLSVGVASLIALPLGVLGAIYLNEYGKNSPLARTIRTMADVMSGVPSVIMGLFIYLIFVIPY